MTTESQEVEPVALAVTSPGAPAPESRPFASSHLLEGRPLWHQQFAARIWTRARAARRDRKAWASQLALPALFVLMALIIAMVMEVKAESPPLKLSTDMFIGTVNGGRFSLNRHQIPLFDDGSAAFGGQVADAFGAAMGSGDQMMELDLLGKGHSPMSHYLMNNSQQMLTSSYGAISIASHHASGEAYSGESAEVTLWFKNRAYHSIPAMLSICNNARLRLLGFEDTRTEAWSHPLPKTQAMLQEELSSDSQMFTDLTVAVTMILAMGFIPASFVVYLVHEKATQGKHQQLLTGISPVMYWVTSYVWDVLNYLIPMLFCFCLFLAFQLAAYSGENAFGIFFVLLTYGLCMTPYMYCIEPLFSVPSTAYVTLICVNIFTGTTTVLATSLMDMLQNDTPDVVPWNDFLKAVCPFLFPNYCLGRGMIDIATNHYIRYAAKELGMCPMTDPTGCTKSSMAWDVGGRYVCCMALMSAVWLSLRLLIEWRFFSRLCALSAAAMRGEKPRPAGVDEEVRKEANRIAELTEKGIAGEDKLVASGLAKTFVLKPTCGRRTQVHSVRGVSVGVPSGECFGLLGVNGAGKTTTMRMITGDIEADEGDVFLSGWSVKSNRDKARRHLGYCPQFDALPDKLTARETLNYYAQIRGIAKADIPSTVEAMIQRMCLEAHQHQLCEHLSGGNKRKLSTAMSLIGEPDVVLLDEPSTGIDVGARRFLWDVLGDIRERGHALVLTSHSMDECEVLCTRLTIMVSGEFRCLGSPLQLKEKYGGGYTLAVKVQQHSKEQGGSEVAPRERLSKFISAELPQARLTEENVGLFRYRLGGGDNRVMELAGGAGTPALAGRPQVAVADVFKMLEDATNQGGALQQCVSDYTLSQTTLEEVFLHFSQLAEQAEEPEKSEQSAKQCAGAQELEREQPV
jgi:ABC-type multidrug transport system ATPase subunit